MPFSLKHNYKLVGKGRRTLEAELSWRIGESWLLADGGVVAMEDENPDDAAIENIGIGVTLLLFPFICHAQFENLGEETAWILFWWSVAISCHEKV